MPAKKAPSTLTGHAAEIWESAYESAWKQYNPDKHSGSQEEYAAKVAWGAVKRDYRKNKDGKWVKKSLATFSLRITKTRVDGETGKIRWHANAASDEMFEGENEVLHVSLFDDLENTFQEIRAAYDNGEEPPIYDEFLGKPNEPILDLSHYTSRLAPEDRNDARLGSLVKLYRDGNYLHADGFFDETPQGQMVAKSIAADEAGDIRVSVGFFPDYGNIEIVDDVLYWKGGRNRAYLDHLAVTSCPRIPTTSIEAEGVMMSGAKTQAEDALVVLGEDGEELVESLEEKIEKQLQNKSMVMKSESDTETEGDVETEEEIVESETQEGEEIIEPETLSEADNPTDTETEEVSVTEEGATEEVVEEEEKAVVLESEMAEPQVGPTTFDAALSEFDAYKESSRIADGWAILQMVVDNIQLDANIEDKSAAVKDAMEQYKEFIDSGRSLFSTTEEVETVVEEEVVLEQEPEVVAPVATNPVVNEPPEAQPFSVLDTTGSGPGAPKPVHGTASTWGELFDKVQSVGGQPQARSEAVIAQPEQAVEVENVPVDVETQVENKMVEILNPLLAEMAALRQLLEQGTAVKEETVVTPNRGVRKSMPVPQISPSRETTRQRTFADVVNQLREQRKDLYGSYGS